MIFDSKFDSTGYSYTIPMYNDNVSLGKYNRKTEKYEDICLFLNNPKKITEFTDFSTKTLRVRSCSNSESLLSKIPTDRDLKAKSDEVHPISNFMTTDFLPSPLDGYYESAMNNYITIPSLDGCTYYRKEI